VPAGSDSRNSQSLIASPTQPNARRVQAQDSLAICSVNFKRGNRHGRRAPAEHFIKLRVNFLSISGFVPSKYHDQAASTPWFRAGEK